MGCVLLGGIIIEVVKIKINICSFSILCFLISIWIIILLIFVYIYVENGFKFSYWVIVCCLCCFDRELSLNLCCVIFSNFWVENILVVMILLFLEILEWIFLGIK